MGFRVESFKLLSPRSMLRANHAKRKRCLVGIAMPLLSTSGSKSPSNQEGSSTPQERRQQAELDRMFQHPEDKSTLTQITDQSFRSKLPGRVVDQMVHILDVQGVPRFFSVFDQALLKGFQSFGEYLPGVAVPRVKEKMREETANVILPAEHDKLPSHLRERSHEGLRMNVNFLGEAILGERESSRRLDRYLTALQLSEIECVSIKISTHYAPACQREEFINAIGYLVRRMDENTGPDNFLRHAFKISAGGATWQKLENGFLQSVERIDTVSDQPRRQQDRRLPPVLPPKPANWQSFVNDADTATSVHVRAKNERNRFIELEISYSDFKSCSTFGSRRIFPSRSMHAMTLWPVTTIVGGDSDVPLFTSMYACSTLAP